ncbi:hypothetical protein F0562_019908 [Nyssa sinensis]|uniref:F-box domain-containing protein n=1 Tax=Nyssa sinensis TaxID=561372 RepID=A0A5J5BPX1_9ASTE|nr:hypothetical protein F0562_019908 [Nyssa sinensis]
MAGLGFNMLPNDSVSTILSLTSPPDVCRSSLVSSTFRSAADSYVVWERFLPSDYWDIVSRSVTPLKFSSKHELFFCLCNPILIDGGNKSFTLEKSTGKKSYILSARELSITWGDEPTNWSWKYIPESRFSEVAVLKTISQLEVQGKIKTQMLSQNTTYGAYLIVKVSDGAYGLDSIPSEISIEVGNHVSTNTAYLQRVDHKKQQMECLFYMNRSQMLKMRVNQGVNKVLREREDGWMEIELGEFFSAEGDEEVKMSLMEVKGHHLKGGLIIEGIEVRHKHK